MSAALDDVPLCVRDPGRQQAGVAIGTARSSSPETTNLAWRRRCSHGQWKRAQRRVSKNSVSCRKRPVSGKSAAEAADIAVQAAGWIRALG
jgi:hypothetical protein